MRGLCLAVLLLACGGSQKPPPLAEVPINEGTPSNNNPPPGDDPAPVGDTSGALPVEGAHDAGAPVDAGGGAKKANVIGEADCRKVIKKYADFIAKGTSAADLESNPVYGQMLSQCQVETTKKQYTCAMASRNKTGWETCMK